MPVRKPTRPGVEETNMEFTWDNFCSSCCNGNYILVVGSEAVLSKKENVPANGDSKQLLFDCTKDYLESKDIKVGKVTNFNQLSQNINKLREKVIDTIEELDYRENFDKEIDPDLFRLLMTKCFRVVLTTTIDPYLEIAMERVWGKDGFRILNIYNEAKDIPFNELNNDEFNEIKPTLYYVFGKADASNRKNKFVLSENDAMSVISKWFSSEKPKELLRYIHGDSKMVIAVGCKFDDWLFRFFWFILRGSISNLSNGQVAIEFMEEDEPLKNYLRNQRVQLFTDARRFMHEAANKLEEAINVEKLPRHTGGIFISYAHEDKHIALPLFNKLTKEGFSVWLDEKKLNESDEYEVRINRAINACKIFMPILSTQVKSDLSEKKKSERYYITKEWTAAQNKIDVQKNIDANSPAIMKVLPIVIGDYDVTRPYHQNVTPCITNVTALCNLSNETFDSLRTKISKLL